MSILQSAKPKENLLNAPLAIQHFMRDYVDYFNLENVLRSDIAERFNYPSLLAAIDRLLEHRKQWVIAYMQIYSNGYTSDDAFMFDEYENEDD